MIRGYASLPSSCKLNLVESLRSNLSVLLPNVDSLTRTRDDDTLVHDRVASHRNAFKIYTFFLINVVLAEESNSGSSNNPKVLFLSLLFACSHVCGNLGCDIATFAGNLVKSFGHGFR